MQESKPQLKNPPNLEDFSFRNTGLLRKLASDGKLDSCMRRNDIRYILTIVDHSPKLFDFFISHYNIRTHFGQPNYPNCGGNIKE